MMPLYEDKALVRCPETSESTIVNIVEFTPQASLTVDIFVGTPHSRRLTLKWNTKERDYRADIWGRELISRGPKVKSLRGVTTR